MVQQIAGLLFIATLTLIIVFYFLDRAKKRKPVSKKPVSIIVPCYNDSASVGQTIGSIYEVIGSEVDLIVVNDKSTDNSQKILESLKEKYDFKLLSNVKNLGKSASLNKASKLAKHNFLFFIDADVEVSKKAFNDAMTRLEQDNIAAVSCPYVPLNKGFLALMQHIEYNMLSIVQGSYNLFSAIALWGGFVGVKKNLFFKVGCFSLNAITEDMDLAFKFNQHNWRVEQSFIPVKTHVPAKLADWFSQKLRWISGTFQCFFKYPKIWIRNPIHIFFILSYCLFIVLAVIALVKNIIFLNDVIDHFHLENQTLSPLLSFKSTILLYGAYFLKYLLWMVAFTLFSVPYVIPLIKSFKKIHLIFLIIPFSVIYIPMFSTVAIFAFFSMLYRYRSIQKGARSW